MEEPTHPVAAHYDAVAESYHEQYRRESLFEVEDYSANYFRLQLLAARLGALKARNVFDIGFGDGTPLATFAEMGLEVAGCDISTGMVEQARKRFADAGLPVEAIGWGDVEDSATLAPYLACGPFDAVVAAGACPTSATSGASSTRSRASSRPVEPA